MAKQFKIGKARIFVATDAAVRGLDITKAGLLPGASIHTPKRKIQ